VYAHEIQQVRIPEIDFRVVCSKGFYVRTYANDIGQELNCGAHLTALRRTKSGRFSVDGAVTIEELKTLPREELASRVLSLPEVSRLRGA
jgi:tRNA pseudouridine55 synthase